VGYTLIDLDVVTVAEETGLLDILLDAVIGTSCSASFELPELSASAKFELDIELSGEHFTEKLTPVKL
jgi:EAL domain-containing protein (putative c-di-GMP-specific phosphodiesterase class I)